MSKFTISRNDKLPISIDKKHKLTFLEELIESRQKILDELSLHKQNDRFVSYWQQFDLFKIEKPIISKIGPNQDIDISWIHIYEIINQFNILPHDTHNKIFKHLDRSKLIGAYIQPIRYFVKSRENWYDMYSWEYCNINSNCPGYSDRYKYTKKHADYSINLDELEELDNKLDLYTSDECNMSIIIDGLKNLSVDGNMILKHDMNWTKLDISLLYLLSNCFNTVSLFKPSSLRTSEGICYIICEKFLNHSNIDLSEYDSYINLSSNKSLYNIKDYHSNFIKEITNIIEKITNDYNLSIKKDIEILNHAIEVNFNGFIYNNPVISAYYKDNICKIEEWYMNNPVLQCSI